MIPYSYIVTQNIHIAFIQSPEELANELALACPPPPEFLDSEEEKLDRTTSSTPRHVHVAACTTADVSTDVLFLQSKEMS